MLHKIIYIALLLIYSFAFHSHIEGSNLLENSSFEIDSKGFSLSTSHDISTPLNQFDQTTAFHGQASLKLEFNEDTNRQVIVSKIYKLKPSQQYTISCYATSDWGSADVTITLVNTFQEGGPADVIGPLSFRATGSWARYSFTGTSTATADKHSYQLKISPDHQGTPGEYVWIDAIQIEEGTISDYAHKKDVIIDLVAGDGREGNVFFEDESVVMKLKQYNNDTASWDGNIKYEVYDYYNLKVKEGTVNSTIPAQTLIEDDLDLSLTQDKRGCFRAMLWIEGVDETYAETVYSVLPRPGTLEVDETSMFGTHVSAGVYFLSAMQKTGVKWNRSLSTGKWFRWSVAEPTDDAYVWFDDEIGTQTTYGLTVLGVLGSEVVHVPSWAKYLNTDLTFQDANPDTITSAGGGFSSIFLNGDEIIVIETAASDTSSIANANNGVFTIDTLTDTVITLVGGDSLTADASAGERIHIINLEKWEDFVTDVVTHYKADVGYWEIWNEPDTEGALANCAPCYARLLQIAYDAAKAADATATIVGMVSSYDTYITDVFAEIGSGYSDLISTHRYPPLSFSQYDDFMTVVAANGDLDVWNTETGMRGDSFYQTIFWEDLWIAFAQPDDWGRDYRLRTDWQIWNFARTMKYDVKKYFYYESRQSTALDFLITYSLLEWDGALRPKGVAYSVLAKLFDGSVSDGIVSIDANVESYSFLRGATPLVIMWVDNTANYYTTDIKEVDSSLEASQIKAYNIMGNELSIVGGLDFSRSPIYLEGQGITKAQLVNSLTVSVGTDTAVPNVSLVTYPTGPKAVGDILFRWIAVDDAFVSTREDSTPESLLYSYQLDDYDTWSSWITTTSKTYSGVPVGSYTFSVRAKDGAGNISTAQASIIIGGSMSIGSGISFGSGFSLN